ncbi:MAG: hypothetical protein PHO18_07625 [Synergistaceae bacterium]|nr:hypothetical protein [Synergistaceae bacterium]
MIKKLTHNLRSFMAVHIILLFFLLALPAYSMERDNSEGWFFPTIGTFNGTWELGVGAHFWDDHFDLRNLQLRADLDLAPGLRWHALARTNRKLNGLDEWDPRLDEHYVEWYGFHRSTSGTFSFSAKYGKSRYLRFPFPDAISTFDQVPGVEDLTGGEESGYSGLICTVDYAHRSGLGLHGVWVDWGLGVDRPAEWAEKYIFYRHVSAPWHFEARYGDLALRSLPLGRSNEGYSLFLGRDIGDWSVGLFFEDVRGQETYTGIVVTFAEGNTTALLGSMAFDYTRSPNGFAVQVPLVSGTIGNLRRSKSAYYTGILMKQGKKDYADMEGFVLVGEVVAERIRTYWQNGQARNWYEHRLSGWGRTSGPGVFAVMVEDPWYLKLEALVSPHTAFSSWEALEDWESDRMGPAQLNQKVLYRFYVPKE